MFSLILSVLTSPLLERLRQAFAISFADIADLVMRAALVYILLLLGIRLTGKREVGQMTPFDLVLLLLISNAVQNSMIGPYNALTAGLVGAFTLLLLNRGMTHLVFKNRRWRKMLEGSPALLIYDGRLNRDIMRREEVSESDLRAALREHGVDLFSQVHMAVLEVDGSISVLRQDERPSVSHPHHRFKFLARKR
jgi:uncharacterized membrane protein YcaP (DUF421 family)